MTFPIKKQVMELDVEFFSLTRKLEETQKGLSLIYLAILYGADSIERIIEITGYEKSLIESMLESLNAMGFLYKTNNFNVLYNRMRELKETKVFVDFEDTASKLNENYDKVIEKEAWNSNDVADYFKKVFYDYYEYEYKVSLTLVEKKFFKDMLKEYGKEKTQTIIKKAVQEWDELFPKTPLTIHNLYGRRETIAFKIPTKAVRKVAKGFTW